MLTCRQLIEDFLADYLEAALPPERVAELETHLALCPPCLAYLNTYRKTRELAGAAGEVTMPPEMWEVLRRVLEQDGGPRRA